GPVRIERNRLPVGLLRLVRLPETSINRDQIDVSVHQLRIYRNGAIVQRQGLFEPALVFQFAGLAQESRRTLVERAHGGHFRIVERRNQRLVAFIIAQRILRLLWFATLAIGGREGKLRRSIAWEQCQRFAKLGDGVGALQSAAESVMRAGVIRFLAQNMPAQLRTARGVAGFSKYVSQLQSGGNRFRANRQSLPQALRGPAVITGGRQRLAPAVERIEA